MNNKKLKGARELVTLFSSSKILVVDILNLKTLYKTFFSEARYKIRNYYCQKKLYDGHHIHYFSII